MPSGPYSLAVGSAAATSLLIWTAPLAVTPLKMKQSAPSPLIFWA